MRWHASLISGAALCWLAVALALAADPKPARTKRPAPTNDPVEQMFDFGRQMSKAMDGMGQEALALSWEEEQKFGQQLHRAVSREYTLLRDPAAKQRLERLAKPIIDRRTRKEITFTFHVLRSDKVNSFAYAGGYVYVTTGMLDFAKLDEVLQFFLAHEVAHHELKHVQKRITYAARASQMGGEAAAKMTQMAYLPLALGYSKEQELEADAWAFRAMRKIGRSRDEALAGMKLALAHFAKKEPEPKRGAARNPLDTALRQVEGHFQSHPPTAERLEQLEAIRP